MTPTGIEPATFRLVAQWLYHLVQRVPQASCTVFLFFFNAELSTAERGGAVCRSLADVRSLRAVLRYRETQYCSGSNIVCRAAVQFEWVCVFCERDLQRY